jgi:hypothetical protein
LLLYRLRFHEYFPRQSGDSEFSEMEVLLGPNPLKDPDDRLVSVTVDVVEVGFAAGVDVEDAGGFPVGSEDGNDDL